MLTAVRTIGIDLDLDHFAKRVILDAMNEATKAYWIKRAEAIEAARPRPGGFYGRMTLEEARAKWLKLTEIATACRNKAAMCEPDDAAIDLDNVWAELAA